MFWGYNYNHCQFSISEGTYKVHTYGYTVLITTYNYYKKTFITGTDVGERLIAVAEQNEMKKKRKKRKEKKGKKFCSEA